MKTIKLITVLVLLLLTQANAKAQKWESKQAPLMTKFAKDVDPDNVLPEYPRPQMAREKWMNLNGLWQYQPGTWVNEPYPQGKLDKTILVPFAVESALSGVMERHERLWYRRTFTIPADWKDQRVLLNFGAVDYESEVFINDKSVGTHQGGYDPFSFDITDYLTQGEQTITVKVYDPTTQKGFPRGKQAMNSEGIMYTSTTGIWQTVWLEPVAQTRIENFRITPDIDKSVLKLQVFARGRRANDVQYTAQVKENGKVIATMKGDPMEEIFIPIKNQKLWSPDSPFLYDLTITMSDGTQIVDKVDGYFGMRKISVEQDGKFKKMFLNNKFEFQLGPLDQGFWPDGIYTAPTDEALKYDLEMTKAFGFNMVRKHIKVEPYRWYYWADKLGLMVWQDMPSPNSYTGNTPPIEKEAYQKELIRLVETHWKIPSIIMWVVFNEGQAQHNTKDYCALVKGLDPSRLVNQASGGGHEGVGDVMDIHSYPPPACPTSNYQTLACGEYGGIGYIVPGHTWKVGPTYIMMDNKEKLMNLYDDYATMLAGFKTNEGLSAAVYTEITDVEVELNGLMTYDRLIKADVKRFYASTRKAIDQTIYTYEILPTSKDKARQWQYTTTKPAEGWMQKEFKATSWKTGEGGFGTTFTPGSVVRTEWNSSDIWIRQDFKLGDLSLINLDNLVLMMHHDEECEVYINGVEASKVDGAVSGYVTIQVSAAAKKALIKNGQNNIAIHCHQTVGGQYIDCGLSISSINKPIAEKTINKLMVK